jgi:hypothetical protein
MNPESRPWVYPLLLVGVAVVFIGAELSVPFLVVEVPTNTPTLETKEATFEPLATQTEAAVVSITTEAPPPTTPAVAESTDTPTSVPPTDTPTPAPSADTSTPAPPTEIPTSAPPTDTPTPIPDAVVKTGLNLRSGPGVVYAPPIGYLRNGDTLNVKGRITGNGWIQVFAARLGIEGWVRALPEYVQINIDLETVGIVIAPLAPAPTLLEPGDDVRINICNRLDLFWTWDGELGPDDYYQVEIRNRYNDFSTPIDVAWIKGFIYRYDYLEMAYHPDYRWSVTVVRGIPAGEKDWSTRENPVWEPSNQVESVSEPSATWKLMVDCSPPPPEQPPQQPLPPSREDDDDDDSGIGPD